MISATRAMLLAAMDRDAKEEVEQMFGRDKWKASTTAYCSNGHQVNRSANQWFFYYCYVLD